MNRLPCLLLPLTLCGTVDARTQVRSIAGAAADAHMLDFEQVAYDTPGDGHLWARGATYKASFGSGGATYIPFLGSDAPRNMPVRFRMSEALVGGQPLELEAEALWSRVGDTVILDRGPVDVHYLMNSDSIEQTFVLDFVPRGGELEVCVQVESELELEPAGEGFRLRGERGGVHYGRATAIDGAGQTLSLESRIEGDQIRIRVPESFLNEASFPLVVDPLITTYNLSTPNVLARNGDICFDASSQHYYQVFNYIFSSDDWDVYGSVIGLDGAPRANLGAWIDLTQDVWYLPSCASSNAADNSLVVAVADKGGRQEIWGRVRSLPITSQGGQFQISPPSEHDYTNPTVGGDPNDGTFNRYFVAYSHRVSNDERHILGQSLQTSGALVGAVTGIDTTPNVINRMPHVSKSCGTGPASERRFNVVWMREDGDDWDIRGAQMNSYGFLMTPHFSIDSTSDESWTPQVSPPLDAPEGATRDFLVVYTSYDDTGSSIRARLFKDDAYQASFDINELEADLVGDQFLARAQSRPTIGTDGTQFVIAYTERHEDSTTDIFACSLRHHGSLLIATEAHVEIANNDSDFVLPNLATQHDAGALGSRAVGLDFRNQEANVFETVMGAIYETPDAWGLLGQTFCSGLPNSTGQSASFRVFGSSEVGDNRLVLDVNGLPSFSSGQFIMSSTTQTLPFGDGVLCLAQPVIRLRDTIGNSWVQGSVGHELDLTSIPGVTLQAGQTWHFQYWYRDGSSFNFSNAESVSFE